MAASQWRRRRRRRLDKVPLSGNLLLDERMKEDVGIISDDLYSTLFPSRDSEVSEPKNAVRHVAITPWVPNSQASIQNTTWTVIPVRAHEVQDSSAKSAHSSVRLPVSSLSLQSFYKTLQLVSPGKALLRRDTPIEIRIVNVVPVALEAVYVTLDVDGLLKLHDSHVKFGGGFTNGSKTEPLRHKALNGVTGQQKPKTPIDERALEATWRQAVKTALSSTSIVHAGDQIALPLPAHPITHNAAPPAKVTTCEPVSQGFISSTTRIIIIRQSEKQKGPKQLKLQVTNGIPEEDEDTSNEQFYSAAEERPGSMRSTDIDDHSTTDFSDAQSIVTDGEDLTDDEALISLSAPLLPPQTSGILSSYNAATPRPGGFYTNNIGTPGSLQSASTVRAGAGSGKTFKAQGLLQRIPDDLLHPKPPADDDEEARIYVETAALVKIGCFSGDWVRIEAAQEPNQGGLGLVPWHTSFSDEPLAQADWRPVKIFGLPESKKPIRFSSHKSGARRAPSFHYERSAPLPNAYLPPVLLANLASPTHLKITPLVAPGQGLGRLTTGNSKDRITSSSMPPLANEVKILKILSPLSHDIQLQPALYAELKDYFEGKRRIMKTGDLVAISFDETLGRSMYQTGNDAAQDDLLSRSKRSRVAKAAPAHDKSRSSVAWFKVTSIVPEGSKDDEVDDLWGGVGFVDVSSSSSSTKLIQNGNESSRLPPALNSSWQYYQGARGLPGTTGNRLPGTMGLPEPYVSPMRRRLRGLISASTSPQAVHMGLPPLAILLTSTQRQIGKAHTAQRACEDLGLHCCIIDAYDATTNTTAGASETEEYFKARAQRALSCGPQNTVLLLKHMDALTGDRMLPVFKDILAESRVIVATTTDPEKIPEAIRSLFTNELELGAPDEGEREGILRDIVEGLGLKLSPGVELTSIALKTAALVAGDLLDVVSRAVVAKHTRLEKITSGNSGTTSDSVVTVQDLEVAGGSSTLSLTKADFESAVDAARKNFADAIGAPKIPNVGWDDVGGLAHIKEAVMETIQLPLARPELFAKGMKKRSGILFYGPPGTGKTLLAKAIATEFSLNFFSVKGPELLNMYIGESEANVRRVFQRARDARPCVVFFDELDSVAPKRGNQGDSGGVMDRIVSQLLAELDGMSNGEEGGGGVFVIGATNRPDLLDQALLRPGRFDKMLYLGISDTHEKQQKIMEALSRKFTIDPSCSLQKVSQSLPFTYTGADLYALCSDAMLKAITRAAKLVDEKVASRNAVLRPGQNPLTIAQFFDHYATDADTSVTVLEEDFHAAHKELVPSVSADEFGHYEKVRQAFEGKDAPKGETSKAKALPNSKQPLKMNLPPSNHNRQPSENLQSPSRQSSGKMTLPIGRKPVNPTSNGNGQSRETMEREGSTFYFDQAEDIDEYTVRTDHLVRSPSRSSASTVVNGSSYENGGGDDVEFLKQFGQPQALENIRNSIGNVKDAKGKGKGQRNTSLSSFGSATGGDEDLYR